MAGAEILLVSFYPGSRLANWARANKLPYRLAVDNERGTYLRYGLGDARAMDLIGPDVWLAGLKAFRHTARVPQYSQHWQQRGGYFVVDNTGKVVFAYPSKGPADHPPQSDLLEALGVPDGSSALPHANPSYAGV